MARKAEAARGRSVTPRNPTKGVLCIIPARGGSKGLPRKNLRLLGGKPLIVHSVSQARAARQIDRVVVSTDSVEIADVAVNAGAEVIARPPAISGDEASSESALIHVLDTLQQQEHYEPEILVFLQATSPIRGPMDIDNAVQRFRESQADSLVSVVRSHRVLWRLQGGRPVAVNFDTSRRERRQDREGEFVENGSVYVLRPGCLRATGSRIGGRVILFEMDYWSGFEIDSVQDLKLCELIVNSRKRSGLRVSLPADIRLLVLDFDGVLTDNRVLVSEEGTEAVMCSRADGLALAQLRSRGLGVLVLSAERNSVVRHRCEKLGVECIQGASEKWEVLRNELAKRNIRRQQVVYVGNDEADVLCMAQVGLGVAPADAHPAALDAAGLVLDRRGGEGAVRELCDLILRRGEPNES